MLAWESSGLTRLRMLGRPSTFYSRKRHDKTQCKVHYYFTAWYIISTLNYPALVDRSLGNLKQEGSVKGGIESCLGQTHFSITEFYTL